MPPPIIRIFIVEDDQRRVDWFRAWLPKDMRLVHARSGGRALGVIQRDRTAFSGIMLDHDLQQQAISASDSNISGSVVIRAVMQFMSPTVPVMIHSMNPGKAAIMGKALEKTGFSVTRMPMGEMSKTAFLEWLDEVREYHEEMTS